MSTVLARLREAREPGEIKAYVARIRALAAEMHHLDSEGLRRLEQLLSEALERVRGMIARTDWQAHRLTVLKAEIAATLEQFRGIYAAEIAGAQARAWEIGVASVDDILASLGVQSAVAALPSGPLEVMQGYSADLIGGITAYGRQAINGAIARSIIGETGMAQALSEIGRDLKGPSVFRTLWHRSEAVYRTEVNRVYSVANFGRGMQLEEFGLPVIKRWIYGHTTKYPRAGHMAAHGQVVEGMKRRFTMGNGARLLHPHDPGAGAAESVNCGCTMQVLVRGPEGELPPIVERLGPRVTATGKRPVMPALAVKAEGKKLTAFKPR